jgi:8-oxo-dGTP pyrophosphatase MutT (NUDIX family)
MKEISVGAIIFHEHNVLLIHQKHGDHIGFPKGHMEHQETPKMTALREVYEEVGLEVILTEITYDVFYQPSPKVSKKVTYYLAYAKETNLTIQSTEIHQAYWMDKVDALKQLTYQNDQDALQYMLLKTKEE